MTWRVVAIGVAAGVVYAASPLVVFVGLGLLGLWLAIQSIEDASERRWLAALFLVAVALRLGTIAALFMTTDHARLPFGTFFGDEEYFIRRSLWLRNLAVAQAISPADMIYAFDRYIHTGYVWLLAAMNLMFGPSTYGVRLISVLLHMTGSLMLYRTARASFGRPASLLGLSVLWFLPSLFMWSVSALKDPIFFFLLCAVVSLTVEAIRSTSRWRQVWAVIAVLVAMGTAGSIRSGGLVLLAAGTAGGLLIAWAWRRPRLAGLALAVIVVGAGLALTRGPVRDAVVVGVHSAADAHWEHANSSGNVYFLLDEHRYAERLIVPALTFGEATRFVAGAIVAYFTVPLPWHAQSGMAVAYAPEQMIWYGVVLFACYGIWAGMRREPLLTSLLLAYSIAFVVPVALTSGNIGTLVRHRGVALTFIVWLAGLGAATALARWKLPAGSQVQQLRGSEI